jgi:alkylation response protein AidB-like acyl-CoA dehydrogenase
MIEFELTGEQEAVRELARSMASRVLSPQAKAAEAARGVADEVWRQLVEAGVFAPVAAAYGGGGIPDVLSQLIAAEEFAAGDPASAAAVLWHGNAALLIGLLGTPDQCAALLPAFTEPTHRATVAYLEGFGRAPSEYQTTIEPVGDGWRVLGRKVAVPFAAEATTIVVVGRDSTADNKLRAVLLDGPICSDSLSSSEMYLGLNAVPLASVTLDTTVGSDRLLGSADASDDLSRAVSQIRLTTAALSLGTAQRAREYASQYAVQREAFGRPISSFQGVAFMMAEAQMQIDAARLDVWRVALDIVDVAPEAVERAVSTAINYAKSVAAAATRDAVQVLGGHGFLADHPVERWYRAAAGLATIDFDPACGALALAL